MENTTCTSITIDELVRDLLEKCPEIIRILENIDDHDVIEYLNKMWDNVSIDTFLH